MYSIELAGRSLIIALAWMLMHPGISLAQISYKQDIDAATADANSLCQNIPMSQNSTKTQESAQASADLNGILKKFVPIGGSINGTVEQEKSFGVLQKDLASAVTDGNKCRLDATIAFLNYKKAQPSSATETAKDPDGIYQNGQMVAQLVGERVDDANGLIPYQALRSFGHYNSSQEGEFRDRRIVCNGVAGGPPPGHVVGMYIGMTVGGQCNIVGANK